MADDSAAIDAVKPVLTGKDCKQNLPTWGVTREFRFGQFIQLYDERVVNGKRQVTPLKFNSDGDVTELPDAGDIHRGRHRGARATAGHPPAGFGRLELRGGRRRCSRHDR